MYQLLGLTEEEIKIIEGDKWLKPNWFCDISYPRPEGRSKSVKFNIIDWIK